MTEFKFELGQKVEDKITGFSGIIMGRAQYLTQCNCYGILNQKLKDDTEKPKEWYWTDESRLIGCSTIVNLD